MTAQKSSFFKISINIFLVIASTGKLFRSRDYVICQSRGWLPVGAWSLLHSHLHINRLDTVWYSGVQPDKQTSYLEKLYISVFVEFIMQIPSYLHYISRLLSWSLKVTRAAMRTAVEQRSWTLVLTSGHLEQRLRTDRALPTLRNKINEELTVE